MTTGATLFVAAQVALPLTGLPTIYYTSKKSKLAPLFGLLGQPAWFYCAIYTKQWGMFTLNVAYCCMWVLTAYRWWRRVADPRVADPRVADPRVADPRVVDPRVADHGVANPEEAR